MQIPEMREFPVDNVCGDLRAWVPVAGTGRCGDNATNRWPPQRAQRRARGGEDRVWTRPGPANGFCCTGATPVPGSLCKHPRQHPWRGIL